MRRLIKSTYFVEEEELMFTNGIPNGWTVSATGSSFSATKDNSDPFGSHFQANPRGVMGDEIKLQGTGIGSIAKIIEIEIEDLHNNTNTLDTQIILGLASADGKYFSNMNIVTNGQVDIMQQNGSSVNRSTQIITKPNAEGVGVIVENVDVGLVIDTIQQKTQAHFEYSYAEVSGNYPTGQILIPTFRAILLKDNTPPRTKFRKLKLNIYS